MYGNVPDEYRELTTRVDEICGELFALHAPRIACRKGCSECCTNIAILPVEWHALSLFIRDTGVTVGSPRNRAVCPLLVRNACSVYPARPIICRTHGLPLVFQVETYDSYGRCVESPEPEERLTWCDLNFRGICEEDLDAVFSRDAVIDMSGIDRLLETINAKFLASAEGVRYRGRDRLSMTEGISGFSK